MTLRTGKGGTYRYYTCQKHANEGGCDCSRHSIPVPMLDELVLSELETKILTPERLKIILEKLLERAMAKRYASRDNAKHLDRERRDIEAKLDRLYTDRAEGVLTDTPTFRRKIAELEGKLDAITRRKADEQRPNMLPRDLLTSRNIERFTAAVIERLRGESPAFRKAYVRYLVEQIEVTKDEIRISGSKAALAAALMDP